MPRKRGDDFESSFIATRRRLQSLGTVIVPAPTTIPPHTHHAIEIISEPEPVTALLDGVNVQEVEEELGYEKLARSGEQEWLGPDPLDMNHFDVTNVRDAEIESDLTMSGPVGEAIINGPRVIHMTGDDGDNEARIDRLDRVVFNATVTQGIVQDPSVVLFNPAVTADSHPPQQEGATSWDTEEKMLVGRVLRTDAVTPYGPLYDTKVPIGWVMFHCAPLRGAPA
jgi:hypothetical protein